jgi:hypothetical protein
MIFHLGEVQEGIPLCHLCKFNLLRTTCLINDFFPILAEYPKKGVTSGRHQRAWSKSNWSSFPKNKLKGIHHDALWLTLFVVDTWSGCCAQELDPNSTHWCAHFGGSSGFNQEIRVGLWLQYASELCWLLKPSPLVGSKLANSTSWTFQPLLN